MTQLGVGRKQFRPLLLCANVFARATRADIERRAYGNPPLDPQRVPSGPQIGNTASHQCSDINPEKTCPKKSGA